MVLTYAKILLYVTEFHLMRFYALINKWPVNPLPKLSKDQKKSLNNAVKNLLKRWGTVRKEFPLSDASSKFGVHLHRYKLIIQDLGAFLKRARSKESHDLSNITYSPDCPEYFKRNYHYQTDGYFTYDSAPRYDHQIELLFLGVGHVMRKVAYSSLKGLVKTNAEVLEFGAASGISGFQFKSLYPNVSLDLLEPSEAYLKYAQDTYPGLFNATFPEFMENFKPIKKYDCVFSCFVMHEIPVSKWDEITEVIKASLKRDGHLLIIDSQQNCDKKEHQFALDQFEEDFFEPYFKEYRALPLEKYFEKNGFKLINQFEVLFSKALLFSLH